MEGEICGLGWLVPLGPARLICWQILSGFLTCTIQLLGVGSDPAVKKPHPKTQMRPVSLDTIKAHCYHPPAEDCGSLSTKAGSPLLLNDYKRLIRDYVDLLCGTVHGNHATAVWKSVKALKIETNASRDYRYGE